MSLDLPGIGKRLLACRKELDLSQKSMAEDAGLVRSYISHIESGSQNPSFDVIAKLSGKYNLSIDWLLYGRGQMFLIDESNIINKLTPEHIQLIENLLELPENKEKSVIELFQKTLNIING